MGVYQSFLFIFIFLHYKVPSHGIKQPAQKAQEKDGKVIKPNGLFKKQKQKKPSIKKWEQNVKNDVKLAFRMTQRS